MTKQIHLGLAAAVLGVAARGALAQAAGEGNPAAGTSSMDWLLAHFGLIAIIAIVAVFLVVGIPDLLRLSPRRLWALSSVSFRESVRRRVLWVTPLAMLGIIAVTQLSHPVDEQDAIRQTTKYALFASGLVVVVATLILACTSLPKEIDNRVIYTIVTKPATRLEIVLGKTLGFARTSALILLVMGVFSYLYLWVNASQLRSSITGRLQTMPASDLSRDTLQHYADEGLLLARTYARAADLQEYAEAPKPGDKYVWLTGSSEQNAQYTYTLAPGDLDNPDSQLIFEFDVAVRQPRAMNAREAEEQSVDPSSTTRPTTRGTVERLPGIPRVSVTLLDGNGFSAVGSSDLLDIMHPMPNEPSGFRQAAGVVLEGVKGREGVGKVVVGVTSKSINERVKTLPALPDGRRRVTLMITGVTAATLYGYAPDAVRLTVASPTPGGVVTRAIPRVDEKGQPGPVAFRGRLSSTKAQQLRGEDNAADAPVAVYTFDAPGLTPSGETVPFEFRTKIERGDEVQTTEADSATHVELTLKNRKTGVTAGPITITPDADRPTYFRAPAAAVDGGQFDVVVQGRTSGHTLNLRSNGLSVVAQTQSFAVNLFKSLFILWLLSVLVVIISIFCSTFVSWPIAVVLTLVLLLGRWCVVQLGEPSSPQQMATDFFGSNAGGVQTRVFTDTLGALNKVLNFVAKVLPDLDQFRVTEDIERGVTIPFKSLVDPLGVILTFGVPTLILAYVFLRRKEVAP
jgi:ABC-type transport system involved in multi-copper enzyme maturation permease subunit